MSLLDFFVLTLAASAVVDVWFNGSIFAEWRTFFQAKADDIGDTVEEPGDSEGEAGERLPFLMRLADRVLPTTVAELLSCSFCFSHHTPWVVGIIFFFPGVLLNTWLQHAHDLAPMTQMSLVGAAWLCKLPAYALAATRLGNIINALSPKQVRYHSE